MIGNYCVGEAKTLYDNVCSSSQPLTMLPLQSVELFGHHSTGHFLGLSHSCVAY